MLKLKKQSFFFAVFISAITINSLSLQAMLNITEDLADWSDKIQSTQWDSFVHEHFPLVSNRLSVINCSITEFSYKLMADINESAEQIEQLKNPILYWRECTNIPVWARFELVFAACEAILKKNPKMDKPISYTNYSEEGGLQTYLTAHGLAILGFRNLCLNVIDKQTVIEKNKILTRLELVLKKIQANFHDMSLHCRVFAREDMAKAAQEIWAQPGIHAFTITDFCEDINELFIDEYATYSNPVLQPNEFLLYWDYEEKDHVYEVKVTLPRKGYDVCVELFEQTDESEWNDHKKEAHSIRKQIKHCLKNNSRQQIISHLCKEKKLLFVEGIPGKMGKCKVVQNGKVQQLDEFWDLVNCNPNAEDTPIILVLDLSDKK
jgi:hypothetical protein